MTNARKAPNSFNPDDLPQDLAFEQQVMRLHHLTVYSRWLLILLLWLLVGTASLWHLRAEIALWQDYFTWTAVRFAIIYNRLPAIGLSLCIAVTVAALIWHSRNILVGIPRAEKQQLEQQVLKIRQQGQSYPLWRWVCRE